MHVISMLIILLAFSPAQANWWADLWQRSDQQGRDKLASGEPKQAALLFENPSWRAVALYRAQEYQQAAELLAKQATVMAEYNRGNALAKAGNYQQAMAAYDKALQQDPTLEDAQFNRALVEQLVQQQNQSAPGSEQEQKPASAQGENQANEQSAASQQTDSASRQQEPARSKAEEQESQSGVHSPPEPVSSFVVSDNNNQPTTTAEASADEQQPVTAATNSEMNAQQQAQREATDEWLRQIPDDPAALLRSKLQRDYQRRLQGGSR